jgi:hypothetical protein
MMSVPSTISASTLRSARGSATRTSNVALRLRSASSLLLSACSATTFCVVSATAQNMPATVPSSSRTGEYEKVNQVSSSEPRRFMTSGRSSR